MNNSLPDSPDTATFQALATLSIERLPAIFREHLHQVVVQVQEFADRDTLAALDIDDPWELTGLYDGRPVGEAWETGDLPPTITLFRAPLLAEMEETGVTLPDLVHNVVIHEVAHHFGLSDAEIHAIEDEGS